jgi:hypothetical protein
MGATYSRCDAAAHSAHDTLWSSPVRPVDSMRAAPRARHHLLQSPVPVPCRGFRRRPKLPSPSCLSLSNMRRYIARRTVSFWCLTFCRRRLNVRSEHQGHLVDLAICPGQAGKRKMLERLYQSFIQDHVDVVIIFVSHIARYGAQHPSSMLDDTKATRASESTETPCAIYKGSMFMLSHVHLHHDPDRIAAICARVLGKRCTDSRLSPPCNFMQADS